MPKFYPCQGINYYPADNEYAGALQRPLVPQIPLRPQVPQVPQTPPVPTDQIPLPPLADINFIQAYLKQNIGKHIKADFLLGTNTFQDREGTLIEVGVNYFVIIETDTDDRLLCDMYSLKFVRFYQ